MISRRLAAALAAVAATSVVLAGCSSSSGGSSKSSSAASSNSSASSSGGSSLQDQAKAKAIQYEAGPSTYPGPGPTDTVNPGTGKAAVLVCGNAAPVCASQGAIAVDALTKMGWTVGSPVDGQFSPQVEGAFMDRAVQQKLDAVILVAPDVNTFAAQTEAAAAAGVKILCVQCLSGAKWKDKVWDVTSDFYAQGQMAAWKQIADKGDHAKVFAFGDKQFSSSMSKAHGVVDGIHQDCPSCTADLLAFTAADASKPGPPSFTAFLASHPVGTVDYFQPHYDGLAVTVTKTTQNAGRTDFLIGATDGDPAALKVMATSNPPFAFDIAEPFSYEEWVAADIIARLKAGSTLYTGYDKMPSTLIDSTNVKKFLAQADAFPAPADYQAKFLKLWGKA
jgi:ABC-type sugar transport system substrate-binding protein